MSNKISKDDFVILLKETFALGKDFSFSPTGDSMKPMLNGTTDTVVLTKKGEKLKKYDVAMYHRRRDNALVLHRVVKVTAESYIMSGDNQYYFDYDITHSDVLAVVKSFNRKGKNISVRAVSYRIYIQLMLLKKYSRILFSKIYHKFFR
ncbi:MAG: S24/S26 family peptidase [Ruminococcus sp.]|nr:S24/S26 family peptidase [Ruminococcus sp.]